MFSKNIQISNFMKIRPVGAELLLAEWQTDGRTDMMKVIWCMCIRASYMILTRDTYLMQQFIYYC